MSAGGMHESEQRRPRRGARTALACDLVIAKPVQIRLQAASEINIGAFHFADPLSRRSSLPPRARLAAMRLVVTPGRLLSASGGTRRSGTCSAGAVPT